MAISIKKILTLFLGGLTAIYFCGCTSVDLSSSETEENTETIESLQNDYISADDMKNRGHVGVLSEFVSEASIGYSNKDGSKTLYVFAQPINYINEYMAWTPIDTDIKQVDEKRMSDMGYSYTIAASDIKPYYPQNLAKDLGIKLQKNIYQFGVVSDDNFEVELTERENFIDESRSMLVYRKAVGGSDMYVYPSTLGTNVEIEIANPFSKNQFQFWVEIEEGMSIVKQPGGYLTIENEINGETNTLGVIQKPLMKNTEGDYSYNCSIRSVKKAEGNRYTVIFSVDEAFNNAGSSVFVAFEIRREKLPDNCLYSKQPNLTHAFLNNYTVIGNSSKYGVGRLMLRYVLAPFGLDPETINSATYEVFALTNEKAEVELRPVLEDWCSITGNWNNQYETGDRVFSAQMQDHAWKLDITEPVKAWFADESGQLEHNGLQLKYVSEDNGNSILLSNDNSLYMNVTVINFDGD